MRQSIVTNLRRALALVLATAPVFMAAAGEAVAEAPAEQLLAKPPPNWQVLYRFNTEAIRIVEFIPPGQAIDDWDRKITFESYTELPAEDPIEMLLGEAERFKEECEFRQHFNLFSGLENGYPTSARLIMCTKHKTSGEGAVRMMKAIQGEEYFYLIALTKKVAPFEINEPDMSDDEIAGWATFLKMITLCRPGSAEHPCPEGADSAPPIEAPKATEPNSHIGDGALPQGEE